MCFCMFFVCLLGSELRRVAGQKGVQLSASQLQLRVSFLRDFVRPELQLSCAELQLSCAELQGATELQLSHVGAL